MKHPKIKQNKNQTIPQKKLSVEAFINLQNLFFVQETVLIEIKYLLNKQN